MKTSGRARQLERTFCNAVILLQKSSIDELLAVI